MVKYHFITFATDIYIQHAKEICESAIKKGNFDTIQLYTPNDIDDDFKNKNGQIFLNTRGAGYGNLI